MVQVAQRRAVPLGLPNTIPGRRSFSLSSLFPAWLRPTPAPSPMVVAHITKLEAEANVHPHDVAKQLALFNALLDTGFKASYELVIHRWERMCEFDPQSPLLRSDDAFQAYVAALVRSGQEANVREAARRRDTLLAGTPLLEGTPSTADQATPTEAAAQPQTPPPTSQTTGRSDAIASKVLAGQAAAASAASTANPFAAASPDGPIKVTLVENKGGWAPRLARHVFTLAAVTFMFLVFFSVLIENTGFAKNGPRAQEFEPSEDTTVKFSDVHGVDEAKEELKDIVEFLKDPESFSTLGGKLPKGVLLTGPPGTGKTMLARAVAGEAGVPFFFASGSEFEEMFVGVGAKRVRELFAAARKKDPAIIFIDELDAVGGKRNARDQQYMKQTLNQLLVEMDGFAQSAGVIVIAATNFPESLDPALVRPGRFDRHVTVPLPDLLGRAQILKHHMKNISVAPDVDTKVLARGTTGFSGADLQNMVNQAAIQASKQKAKQVDLNHLEWAKDRIIMGAERRSAFISDKVKLSTAYHEGGHALASLYTEGAHPLHKVTCMPRGHSLGHTAMLPNEDAMLSRSFKELNASLDVSMGGRVAEELIYGVENVTSGASSDIQNATSVANGMVKRWGFSKLGPIFHDDRQTSSGRRLAAVEDEVSNLIKESEERARKLLIEKMPELHLLAKALVEHETLNADEVRKVIKGEPIRTIDEALEKATSDTPALEQKQKSSAL
ncbi:ATP-dependent peptidase [Cylindrobasidium torrendii FP15055 ss-10]|uniref:ATP-dependent peptidase n=1 Tax=Cylindrobasidium torrendii FP15055 ss-10 TaxID=1314674 RepID=A0A0D7BLA1_9AGAR|nr:ATP-dependent peptidase [Cylindrobasidium torrendii FP15055 ss-10]